MCRAPSRRAGLPVTVLSRRRAIGMLAATGVGAHLGLGRAAAQSTRAAPPRIGWLMIQDAAAAPGWLDAFRASLRAQGRIEGRDFQLEARHADGAAGRLPALAQDLVRGGVALIVATSQPATDAARRATASVPIVGRMTDDPVQAGVAAALARPGGNVTGVYSLLEETSGKRLALLQQALPSLRRAGALLSLDRGATRHWLSETEAVARQLGIALHTMDVRGPADLDAAFASAAAAQVEAVAVFRNPTVITHAGRVIALAMQHRMASIFDARELVDAGGLMSYGPSLEAMFARMATQADRILAGAAPGDLPIEQPTRLELAINLGAAQRLGIAIPPAMLAQADVLIGP